MALAPRRSAAARLAPRQTRSERTRRRILDAAGAILARGPIDSVPVVEIARRAGELSGGALESRLESLEQCVQELPELQRSFLRQAHDRTSSLDALARKLQRSALAVRKQISRLYELLRQCVDRRLSGVSP